jgi:hypothetical protein
VSDHPRASDQSSRLKGFNPYENPDDNSNGNNSNLTNGLLNSISSETSSAEDALRTAQLDNPYMSRLQKLKEKHSKHIQQQHSQQADDNNV